MCECCFVKENVPAFRTSFVVSVFIATYPMGKDKMQKNRTQFSYIIQLRESIIRSISFCTSCPFHIFVLCKDDNSMNGILSINLG